MAEFDALFPLELDTFAGPEAQAAALADDIAYDAHDIDDGLRAGLFSLEDIEAVPFIGVMLDEIRAVYGALERSRVIHELGRRVITRFVEDAIIQSEKPAPRRSEKRGGCPSRRRGDDRLLAAHGRGGPLDQGLSLPQNVSARESRASGIAPSR